MVELNILHIATQTVGVSDCCELAASEVVLSDCSDVDPDLEAESCGDAVSVDNQPSASCGIFKE